MITATKKYTSRDYEQLPEGAPYQLIAGELVMTPSPVFSHQKIVLKLAAQLMEFVSQRKLGDVVTAPMDVYLSETDVYQPDIIYISHERSQIIHERIKGAPDLVMEVLSPSNAYYDLVQKKQVYESAWVKEYWIIDPVEKTIEVYENGETGFKLLAKAKSNGFVSSNVVPGFSLEVGSLFS